MVQIRLLRPVCRDFKLAIYALYMLADIFSIKQIVVCLRLDLVTTESCTIIGG
jgi:hypothetical protein